MRLLNEYNNMMITLIFFIACMFLLLALHMISILLCIYITNIYISFTYEEIFYLFSYHNLALFFILLILPRRRSIALAIDACSNSWTATVSAKDKGFSQQNPPTEVNTSWHVESFEAEIRTN